MKLSTKLYLGFFIIPAMILMAIAIYSISSFERIDRQIATIYDDRVVPLQQIKQVSDSYAIVIIDSFNKAEVGLISNDDALQAINKAQIIIQDSWNAYHNTNLTLAEEAIIAETEDLFIQVNSKIAQIEPVLKSQNTSQVDALERSLYKYTDPLTTKLQELINLQIRVAKEEREKAELIYAEIQLFFNILFRYFLNLIFKVNKKTCTYSQISIFIYFYFFLIREYFLT